MATTLPSDAEGRAACWEQRADDAEAALRTKAPDASPVARGSTLAFPFARWESDADPRFVVATFDNAHPPLQVRTLRGTVELIWRTPVAGDLGVRLRADDAGDRLQAPRTSMTEAMPPSAAPFSTAAAPTVPPSPPLPVVEPEATDAPRPSGTAVEVHVSSDESLRALADQRMPGNPDLLYVGQTITVPLVA